MEPSQTAPPRFVVCLDNTGYPAALEPRKIYVVVPDPEAEADGDIRVVDESGEHYIYSADRFAAIDVPPAVAHCFAQITPHASSEHTSIG